MNAALFLLFNIDQNEADIQERRRKRAAYRRVNLERKTLRNRSNPFNLEEEHFRKLYRMSPALALDLIDLLQDAINIQGVSYIPVHLQVLAVLQFFALGGYHWQHSDVREKLQSLREDQQIIREEGRYYFLGDSGYTCSPIMLIPIPNAPEGSAEALYTTEHTRTRCQIEQTFGILSNVWFAISRRRVLPYKPRKVALIILACAVLHNFRRLNGVRPGIPVQNHVNNGRRVFEEGDFQAGILERQRLIHRYYRV